MEIDIALGRLCPRIEALAPGSAAGVTLCNANRSQIDRGIFPSLDPSFSAAISAISTAQPYFGSCVEAVATGAVITASDIATESRFDPAWRELCLAYGIRSLQSRPVIVDGEAIGTFVLAYPEPRDESEWDAALMEFGADAVAQIVKGSEDGQASL